MAEDPSVPRRITYPWGAKSRNDPSPGALGFQTKEEAEIHAANMNSIIHLWDKGHPIWNKDYWKVRPEEWIVGEINFLLSSDKG